VRSRAAFAAAIGLALSGCGGSGPLARLSPERAAHETYAESLREAGLDGAALGQEWLAVADAALASAQAATLPIRETGYLDPAKPAAVAWRFDLPRGRRLAVTVTLESASPGRLFLDLFRVSDGGPARVASTASASPDLDYVSRADGAYILRLQPELLRGGRYTITQRTEASLRFPVKDASARDIQSVFGDARDGGSRDHHGVDIFAPRGTAVLAAADGIVRSANTTGIGGKVVWLQDSAYRQSLYYAHLDDWAVSGGQRVRAGDVLGYVGNTGNARTTAPHLHFGIYARGPVDPMPFIRAADRTPSEPSAPIALVGAWGRVRRGPAVLRGAPDRAAAPIATLAPATAVSVRAAISSYFRVRLPDGREGFVEARAVDRAAEPLRVERLARAVPLRDHPSAAGAVIRHLEAGTRVPVLAEFTGFLLVDDPDGRHGWLPRGDS